jgi:hypothetical protein
MGGTRHTDVELEKVLAELMAREPIFHREEWGTSREDFDEMMTPEFWEVGASGRRYSREFVLDELERRHAEEHDDVWATSDFSCQRLENEVYLLTYTLLQDGVRLTRRSTIWRKSPEGWKIVFHQGTIVESERARD